MSRLASSVKRTPVSFSTIAPIAGGR
jgi:hypothetical protein